MKKKTAVSIVSAKEQTKQKIVNGDKKGGGAEKKMMKLNLDKKQSSSLKMSNSDQKIQKIILQEDAYLILEISTAKQLVRYIS